MILELLRRRKPSPRHPTPQHAYDALSEGHCLYASVNACSGPPRREGLRDKDDPHEILVCKAHFGRLRTMPPREFGELERHLVRAFTQAPHG